MKIYRLSIQQVHSRAFCYGMPKDSYKTEISAEYYLTKALVDKRISELQAAKTFLGGESVNRDTELSEIELIDTELKSIETMCSKYAKSTVGE